MFPAFAALIFMASPAQAVEFPDSPKNHWVYVIIADVRSTGFLVANFDGLGYSPMTKSREDIAGCLGPTCSNVHKVISEVINSNGTIASHKGTKSLSEATMLADNLHNPDTRKGLKRIAIELPRLIDEFAPELRDNHLDPRRLKGQLQRDISRLLKMRIAIPGEAQRQFPDVPRDHWAASAIQELRSVGILHGYPTGEFRP